ncbi:MAG TPA: Calx-beta domain-containing protein [Pyrinomonadaceae bacterium]
MKPVRHLLATAIILSLLTAPARAQTGPQLTQSSVAGGGGVSTQGSTRVEGVVGQASAGTSSGGSFTLDGGFFAPGTGPSVQTILRVSANPAVQNSTVGYVITFNVPVTGVDASDFQLTTSGLTGAAVTGVTGSGTTYDVTVDTGTPAAAGATLRLDVTDDDTIRDAGGDPLGGAGTGNGNFNAGEVYTVNPLTARVNDAQVSEPSAAATPLLFTVTLSAPATAGGVSVGYATADGGAAPATGGVACGGAVDYETASGTLSFAAGERIKTVAVNVCADSDSAETGETLLLQLSNPTGGIINDAEATGTITQGTTAGTFLISELRTSGPGGSDDDFVELYNNTGAPLTIAASDGSAGYGIFQAGAGCDAAPLLVATIPNGTVIPVGGHYLLTGGAYSLGSYAAGDQTLASDIVDDRNVAVFSTADVANLSTVNRLDAVGFGSDVNQNAPAARQRGGVQRRGGKGVKAYVFSAAGANGVCELLREGESLPPVSGSTTEHSFFRKQCDFVGGVGCRANGNPKDSNDNSADFMFADTQATVISGVTQRLGAPGPENLSSPVRRDTSGIGAASLDGSVASSAPPNRARSFTSGANAAFGTLTIRRRVVNNTGGNVTRLRFRIIEMTTFPSPGGGQSDLRALSSVSASVGPVNDPTTCTAAGAGAPPCTVTVQGTTLEEPPAQPNGGGINSTLAAGTVTMATPLANNASLNVQFVLGIQTSGSFRFYIIIEAQP